MAASPSSSRVILFSAALIAATSVGISVWRGQGSAPQTESAGTATAPVPAADPATAITQLEARLKANPNDAQGWRMLGEAHREAGNFAESAMALRRATTLDPQNGAGWSMLGEALALAAPPPMSQEARTAFKTALAKDANDPLAAYYLAVANDMDGDHKGAIDDWFALLARSPDGAPWIGEVRGAITNVAAANKIDVARRLAAAKKPVGPAQSVATAAIPGPTPDQMQAATALPKGQQDAMVMQMVEGLARKLDANPNNVDGWIMLMRSRVTLGQAAQANAALAKAKAANPGAASQLDAAARALGL